MSSNYPDGIDSLPVNHADNVGEKVHASTINDLADAINKVEAELGVSPKGTYADVAARLNGGYLAASVIAHAPTGTVGVDRPMLLDAIADTPVGGVLALRNGGDTPYAIDQALALGKNIGIIGAGCEEVMGTVISGSLVAALAPSASPYLEGSVILQTEAATDVFTLSEAGLVVNFRDIGVLFDSSIAFTDTGHAFNMTGPTATLGGTDSGVVSSRWDNVAVFGGDGNHYGFNWTNPLLCTFTHLRAYGGGGYRIACDSFYNSYGNCVFVHPYSCMFVGGTADGFHVSGRTVTFPGHMNMLSFTRPQCIVSKDTLGTYYGTYAQVTNAQYLFYVDDNTTHFSVVAPDMETDVSGQEIRLPISTPMFWDLSGAFPKPASPIAVIRPGVDGTNRSLWSDMSIGGYASQALLAMNVKAGLGTTPPAITNDGSSDDWRGQINFGTGTAIPAFPNDLVDLRFFRNARAVNLYPQIVPLNSATAALGLYVSTITEAQLVIGALNAPAASQPVGTYKFAYTVDR